MFSPKRTPARESSLAKTGRIVGDVTGTGAVARAALAGEKAVIDRLVEIARKIGVSESTIERARALKKMHDRALSVAAILFPWLPNPALLRLIAGESLDDLRKPAPKPKPTKKPAASSRRATGRRAGR